jgi:hypothetical protein
VHTSLRIRTESIPLCCFEIQSTLKEEQGTLLFVTHCLHPVRMLLALMGDFITLQSVCKNTYKNVNVSFEYLVAPKLATYNSSLLSPFARVHTLVWLAALFFLGDIWA